MLEKVKSRLHVRGKCCASCVFSSSFFFSSFFFYGDGTHTLRRNRIAITTF